MDTTKNLMEKKDSIIILLIICVGLIVAYLINCALTYGAVIPTTISNDNWLLFWGGYCGSIFASILGYLAIKYSNKNSEKAIRQQTLLLEKQDKKKKLDNHNQCLRNNLELLNAVDAMGIVANINHTDLNSNKTTIINKKSLIYSYDLQFRYISKIDLHGYKSDLERQYFNCWNEARTQLSQVLDWQLSLIQRIQQNQSDYKMKGLTQQQILNTQQLLLTLKQIGDYSNNNEYQKYQNDLVNLQKEIQEIDSRISVYNNDIDFFIEKIQPFSTALLTISKHLFDLSISLIEEQEKEVNS